MLDPKLIDGQVVTGIDVVGGKLRVTYAKGDVATFELTPVAVKVDGATCGWADTPNSFCLAGARQVAGMLLVELVRENGNAGSVTVDVQLDAGEFAAGGSAARQSVTGSVAVFALADGAEPAKATVVATGAHRTRNAVFTV